MKELALPDGILNTKSRLEHFELMSVGSSWNRSPSDTNLNVSSLSLRRL